MKRIGDSETFVIVRSESGFDKAMDAATSRAFDIARIDDCGHSDIIGWSRSRCWLDVEFVDCRVAAGKMGAEFQYKFRVTARASEDESLPAMLSQSEVKEMMDYAANLFGDRKFEKPLDILWSRKSSSEELSQALYEVKFELIIELCAVILGLKSFVGGLGVKFPKE